MEGEGSRLAKQIDFIVEVDKLKNVLRRSIIMDKSRKENSAEHSWHIALMAIILAEYSDEEIDISRVIKMLIIHDIVEIGAGDTFCYDENELIGKNLREIKAAEDIFGLLPPDQKKEFLEVWQEYEEGLTQESKFAKAMDKLMPLLHNFYTGGEVWKDESIKHSRVIMQNDAIKNSSETLWKFAKSKIELALKKNFLDQ